jgi:hypothetical protein
VFVESEFEEGMGFECLLVEKAWLNNSLLTRYLHSDKWITFRRNLSKSFRIL